MNKPSRLYHTVKYLKARQVTGQIRNRLRSRLENPARFVAQSVPAFAGCRWPVDIDILPPGMQANRATDILVGQLSFLNNAQAIGWMPDWQCTEMPRLWQYNLHYFEWLWALEYGDAKRVAGDWIDNHPLGHGQVGWEPYPISLRVMTLCGVFFGKYQKQTGDDTVFLRKLWYSIFIQAEWLTKHLETHLLGNHLFENGAALALAGSCFPGPAADKWLQTGSGILTEQIPEQILADGMHFELSPMYHSRILYLLAILMATGNSRIRQLLTEPLVRMARALKCVCHPDGQIALLNDSAFGIYNRPEQLIDYCSKQVDEAVLDFTDEYGPFALPDAGYYGWRSEDGNYVICDAAPIGPDYMPGHAHADMFSFELSLKGRRVIVDSGVFDYEVSRMRQYCRSTRAHNTIEINGQDQCEIWAAFRVARRGQPHNVKWIHSENAFQLSAWHDSYKRLKGSPVHYRELNWNKSGKLIIKDIITASKPQSVVSRLHLHPNCKIDQIKASTAWVTYPTGKFEISFLGNGKLSVEDSFYCPEFGVKMANKALAFSFSGSNIETGFQIEVL